jgi:hypothetical protein
MHLDIDLYKIKSKSRIKLWFTCNINIKCKCKHIFEMRVSKRTYQNCSYCNGTGNTTNNYQTRTLCF